LTSIEKGSHDRPAAVLPASHAAAILGAMPHSARAPLRTLHPASASLSDEGARALQAVRGLVGTLTQTARVIEQRTGVSNAQLFLLEQIATEPGLSVNALAARAMTHQSTASVVLSRLERRGLVQRVRSSMDARSVGLRLTAAGRRLLRRAPAPATSQIVDAIARLTPSEVRMLRQGVCALAREAGFKCERTPMLFQEGASRTHGGRPAREPKRVKSTPAATSRKRSARGIRRSARAS
jgi:DNA-binding MarR family transcriptional regulator